MIKGSDPFGRKIWIIAPGKQLRPAEVIAE